jgi:hypothetical protein
MRLIGATLLAGKLLGFVVVFFLKVVIFFFKVGPVAGLAALAPKAGFVSPRSRRS